MGYAINGVGGWRSVDEPAEVIAGETYSATMPVPPALTLAQQAAQAVDAGLSIALSGSISLAETLFATDPQTQSWIDAEVTSILLNGTFVDGASTVQWPDATGALHDFTVPQFKIIAAAVGAYVGVCRKCIIGSATALPPASIPLTV